MRIADARPRSPSSSSGCRRLLRRCLPLQNEGKYPRVVTLSLFFFSTHLVPTRRIPRAVIRWFRKRGRKACTRRLVAVPLTNCTGKTNSRAAAAAVVAVPSLRRMCWHGSAAVRFVVWFANQASAPPHFSRCGTYTCLCVNSLLFRRVCNAKRFLSAPRASHLRTLRKRCSLSLSISFLLQR